MQIPRDTFAYEVPATAVASSPRWKTGQGAGLDFESTGSGVAIECGTSASNQDLRTDQPETLNQRLEMSIQYSTQTTGSQCETSVIGRWMSNTAYVRLRFNHITRYLELVEKWTGFDTTLISLPYPTAVSNVQYASTDAGTHGSWIGVYGSDGYDMPGYGSSIPGYASVSIVGGSTTTYSASTSDTRALQKALTPSDRIAAAVTSGSNIAVNVSVSDGLPHKVGFYLLDWNNTGAAFTINVIRISDGVTLDSRSFSSLSQGLWAKWIIDVPVEFQFIATSGSAMFSGIFFDTVGAEASCRLEMIGRRARVWYEASGNGITDRPPDAAVDLANISTGQTDWGIGYLGDATNNFRITAFSAQDIASSYPSIPGITITTPSLQLTPVTCVASGLGSPGQIQWQVSPADPTDFPEVYEDLTDAAITSHVIWVRPGYLYNYRARLLTPDGYGPWTPTAQFTTGSKTVGSPPPTLDTSFPNIVPDYVMELTNTAMPNMFASNTGHDRVAVNAKYTRRTWKLTFANRLDSDYQAVFDFIDYRQGMAKSFMWTSPESGEVFAVHFATDDPEITYSSQGINDGTNSPIAQISVMIEEIDITGEESTGITLSLTVDPSVF